jgi:DTW domain-containing protein YfiP
VLDESLLLHAANAIVPARKIARIDRIGNPQGPFELRGFDARSCSLCAIANALCYCVGL